MAETDLGEYLIQIRHETPSHIIAPAIHLTQDQVEADFRRLHTKLPADRQLIEPSQLVARGAPDPAREVPRRRRRHHRRQLPDRRDRLDGDRHQRGQRRPHAVAAQGAHRARLHREDGADPGGRGHADPPAGALGDGAGDLDLHDVLDRAAARRRSGRARGLPHRHPRQRPLGAARHPVPGGAALHPLRGVHEPLPGLRRHRRARLRLGLSGPDRRGADAGADRRALGQAPAQRLDLLRALRGGVPDEDPAAGADAALAGGGVRRGRYAADVSGGAQGLGCRGEAAAALPRAGARADAAAGRYRAAARRLSAGCRWRAAGRGTATSPRRRAARSRRCGPTPRRGCPDERGRFRCRDAIIFRVRKGLGVYDSDAAARSRRRAPRRAAGAAGAGSGPRAGATSCAGCSASSWRASRRR